LEEILGYLINAGFLKLDSGSLTDFSKEVKGV